ncbi:MAG: hypothetical protein ACXWK6_04305 [Myxococcaceae bacterium]
MTRLASCAVRNSGFGFGGRNFGSRGTLAMTARSAARLSSASSTAMSFFTVFAE